MATKASEEQLLYAKILEKGMRVGLLGLFATCAIYMSQIMPATIPVDQIPMYWGMSVGDYLAATGIHQGWSWTNHLGRGDMLNYMPIAILAGVTIICYLAIVPVLLKKGDKVYAVIAVLEVVTLVVAASGILGSGGH